MKNIFTNQQHGGKADKYLFSVIVFMPFFLAWVVFVKNNMVFDLWVFEKINPYITSGTTSFMRVITYMGNYQFLVPANLLLILFFLYKKNNRVALFVLAVAVTSLLLKLGLKEVFHRPRPDNPIIAGITNFSFPSGHASMSIAFYGLLIWLFWIYIKNKKLRVALITLCVIIILLIGFSRIYLRVHYTTDVIAGYCIGIAWLWFCLWITKSYRKESAALL